MTQKHKKLYNNKKTNYMTHTDFEKEIAKLQLKVDFTWNITNGVTQSVIKYTHNDKIYEVVNNSNIIDYENILACGKVLMH